MTQDEAWITKYNEVVEFVVKNKRNPSKYDAAERGLYVNWIRHNRKLLNSGEMKANRKTKFQELIVLMEEYRHVNQYVYSGGFKKKE